MSIPSTNIPSKPLTDHGKNGLDWQISHRWKAPNDDERYNGFFCRYYIVATKHLAFEEYGNLGVHVAYVYNKKDVHHLNGPAIGADFKFSLPQTSFINKAVNNFTLMAEYDSRTINLIDGENVV